MSFSLHKSKSAGLSQIKIAGKSSFHVPGDKAEAFNNHFKLTLANL